MKRSKIFRFLASLKLAVVLLVALAFILAAATYYESVYDTKTAHHLVYGSPLFAIFLTMLGVNVFCSAAIRYPWKPHQTGFVVTHLGIIIILAGSLVTMMSGVDGTLALREGESGKRVTLDEPVLYFGSGTEALKEIQAEFRWSRPRPDNPARYQVTEGLTAVIDEYYHHSESETRYEAAAEGLPAVQFRLHNDNVDLSEWLTTSVGRLPLGPATVRFSRLPDADSLAQFQQGHRALDMGQLQLLIGSEPYKLQVAELTEKPTPVEGTAYSIRLLRYLPHAVVREGELVSGSDDPINPTVEVEILGKDEASQRWLLFSELASLNTRTASSGPEMPVRLLYSMDTKEPGRSLDLALGPDGQIYCRIDGENCRPVKPGDKVPTGWMNLEFELLDFVEKAKKVKEFREVKPAKNSQQEGPPPAIRLTLEGAPEPGPYWLQRGDIIQVPAPSGQLDKLVLGYGLRTVKLDFEIKLKDFEVGFDPGTTTAASYQSTVEVEGQEHLIAMNEPLERDGYKVFQASFAENAEGEPVVSVFSIAKDPGIGLKYGGSILLVLGIIIMFYIKPYMIKNSQQTAKSHVTETESHE